MSRHNLKSGQGEKKQYEATFTWQDRAIRINYEPRRWAAIDHVEIRSGNGSRCAYPGGYSIK